MSLAEITGGARLFFIGERMKKELVKISINELEPYANNPRINTDAVEPVKESMEQCGYISPIIVDENNVILAGHTRLQSLKAMKEEVVEVLKIEGMTEEQKKKYRILDNKTNEVAIWDIPKLELELEGIDWGGFDFGFDAPEGESLFREQDELDFDKDTGGKKCECPSCGFVFYE